MEQNLRLTLIFVHGFLGQPSDWQPVINSLDQRRVAGLHFLDLNHDFSVSELSFQSWPEAFLRWMRHQQITTPCCLIGYSMGGRLLGPLLEKGFARKAIFISSQFGLPGEDFQQRGERRLSDQIWAQRFLEEPWPRVSDSWNQQTVFKNSTAPVREEEAYDRQKLAALLTGFSLSEQKDYSFLWNRNDLKFLYLAGDQDLKYRAIAEEIQSKAINTKVRIVKNAGHRLLLDQPQAVATEISNFLEV